MKASPAVESKLKAIKKKCFKQNFTLVFSPAKQVLQLSRAKRFVAKEYKTPHLYVFMLQTSEIKSFLILFLHVWLLKNVTLISFF